MNKMALFAIIGTAMFLLGGGTAFAATPSGPVHIQPSPQMNMNITWSTFQSNWNPLEYNNGTSLNNLSADLSNDYANPITINPAGIVSKNTLQNNQVAGKIWNNQTPTEEYPSDAATGAVASAGNHTIGGINEPYMEMNSSLAGTSGNHLTSIPTIEISDLPSNNIQYDFITMGISFTGSNTTGAVGYLSIYNGTQNSLNLFQIYPGQTVFFSLSLKQLEQYNNGRGFNLTGTGAATEFQLIPSMQTPKAAGTDHYILTVTALALTEYPILLGQNATGSSPNLLIGNAKLSTFAPTEPMTIYNNSYTVAVSQPLQSLTTQQNAISSGNYIEQVEYQGNFALPGAPDLSYGSANLTEQFNVSTSQTQVLDINGVSYLSTISGKNGTVQLLSSVNPNSQIQFLQIVDYTQSQWNSISNSPGLFTLAGIEYYWWIAVGGLATLIGLGAAAKHAGTKADQERIRRGR